MKAKQAIGIGFAFVLLLAVQLLAVLMIPSVLGQAAQPTVFKRAWSYSPPPVGHFNFFYGPMVPSDWILDGLAFYFPANGTYTPALAESWQTDPNYRWFVVRLRHGVKYHDGHEFTVKDVLSTLYTFPYLNKDRLWYYIKDVKVVDDYTLNFTFTEPTNYPIFYILWHWCPVSYSQYGQFYERVLAKINQGYSIYSHPAEFADILNDLKNFRPTTMDGAGPYKVKSVSEEKIILEKFDNYYGPKPTIDEIHLIRYAAADVMWTDILTGQLDYTWAFLTPEQYQVLSSTPWAFIVPIPRPVGITLYINKRIYPLSLLDVRRALAYAINRTEVGFVQYPLGVTPSKYVVGFHPTGPYETYLNSTFMTQYLAPFEYRYDPQRAEQLLQGLGFTKGTDGIYVTANGTRLEFELSFGGYISAPACENIAAQLKKVGIKITVRAYESGVYFRSPDGPFYVGGYQLGVGVYGSPSFAFDEYYHKYMALFPGHGFAQMQRVPWRTQPVNVTKLAKDIALYPVQVTQAQLTEIYSELSYITGDQLPVINLYHPTVFAYINKEKFAITFDPNYWASIGSYEVKLFSYVFRLGYIKPKMTLAVSQDPTEGGTLSLPPGVYGYPKGQQVTVTVTPASGYSFSGWELDGASAGTSTSVTVTMDRNRTLKAVFTKPTYDVYIIGAIVLVVLAAGGYYVFRREKT